MLITEILENTSRNLLTKNHFNPTLRKTHFILKHLARFDFYTNTFHVLSKQEIVHIVL